MIKSFLILLLFSSFLAGCAGVPLRPEVKVDLSLPIGKIEGDQFIGIRFPFKVQKPPHWNMTTEIPEFMKSLGYEKEGLAESELFIFNPQTMSNVQIDFTPAGRYAQFSQEVIELLTTAALGSLKEELEKEYGKEIEIKANPTSPITLKGVQFAAQKSVFYSVKEGKREQGWVYGFSEPYQIFILYMIIEKEGFNDKQDIKRILESFEVPSPDTLKGR